MFRALDITQRGNDRQALAVIDTLRGVRFTAKKARRMKMAGVSPAEFATEELRPWFAMYPVVTFPQALRALRLGVFDRFAAVKFVLPLFEFVPVPSDSH